MKINSLVLTTILSFLSLSSVASAHSEKLEFNILFEVPRCTEIELSQNCAHSDALPKNITFLLDNCTTAKKRTTCSKMWQGQNFVDGHFFASTIEVKQETNESNSPIYTLGASFAFRRDNQPNPNAKEPSSVAITLGKDGRLSNQIKFYGEKLEISKPNGSIIAYRPYLVINPN